jgi:glucose-6-phosphate 1-dehydrogenase
LYRVNFHPVPHAILPQSASSGEVNRLVIRLQPNEGVKPFLLISRCPARACG